MKFFSTDGIRGKAYEILSSNIINKIVNFMKINANKVIIGHDTRESSEPILKLICEKLISLGINVDIVNVCPTPLISYLMKSSDYDYGIMITASHNHYEDNGIKLFNKYSKIGKKDVDLIINNDDKIEIVGKKGVKKNINGKEKYLEFINSLIDFNNHKRIVLDAANGALSDYLSKLNLDNIDIINNSPNGKNINNYCGSLYPELLLNYVKENNYDYGFSFDGDGDRLIAVDRNNIYDGDDILLTLAKEYSLNKIVHTKLTNRAFIDYCYENGINNYEVDVGDINVLNMMKKENALLGGEPSGHIILLENETSDGLITLIKLLKILNKHSFININKYYSLNKNFYNLNIDRNQLINFIESSITLGDYYLLRFSGTEDILRLNIQIKDYSRYSMLVKRLENY